MENISQHSMIPLYHITHIRNLLSIIASGGIFCDRLREQGAVENIGIAHKHIKERRKQRSVCGFMGLHVAAGGTLWDYVPFYFAPRSPMLYTINQGNVEGYSEGQLPIVYLVTSVGAAASAQRAFAFTDGHAEIGYSQFSDKLEELEGLVDWGIMESKYWNDTAEQPDRKRKRQAEFLVYELYPWDLIHKMAVINREKAQEVEAILGSGSHRPEIIIKPDWYY